MAEPKTTVNIGVDLGLNPGDEDPHQGIALLFFAYRDFTARGDAILAAQNFGRAHHRVIYFVGRHPGITVSELLDILGITKQSIARVLGQLVREEYVMQKTGTADRRQRLLYLTDRGRALEQELTSEQQVRLTAAFKEAGPAAVEGFCKVMLGTMDPASRRHFQSSDKSRR